MENIHVYGSAENFDWERTCSFLNYCNGKFVKNVWNEGEKVVWLSGTKVSWYFP